MTTQPPVDMQKAREFTQKVVGDLSGTMATAMCIIGDRLGLFKDLAANGTTTSDELAARTGINERYAREWLSAMTCAGYLEYEAAGGRFALPPEHAPVVAQEGGRVFLGGVFQFLPAMLGQLDRVTQAFKHGGGVPQSDYGPSFWDGFERYTTASFENLLMQQWLPAVPEVEAKLKRGALVADVGCGAGRAIIKLAEAFPESRFVGYDIYEPSVATATARAQSAGVADRVRFEQQDIAQGFPVQYDLVTTFDVVHDAVDPGRLLAAIRRALSEGGSYLMVDVNAADNLEDNIGPISTVKLGFSILYCMTTSLAGGGEGLGTMGLPESKVRQFCIEAGFNGVRRAWEDPFRVVFEVKP